MPSVDGTISATDTSAVSTTRASSPRVHVYIVGWNESVVLPYTVRFYRERLGSACAITYYDNESDDGSADIARSLGCEALSFSTGGKFSDAVHRNIKNSCWKSSNADWIVVVDADEWVDVRQCDLNAYEAAGVTVVVTCGVQMISGRDTYQLDTVFEGIWGTKTGDAVGYSKPALFDCRAITDLNSTAGGHHAHPVGRVKWLAECQTIKPPWLYHMKYFHYGYLSRRAARYALRLSEENFVRKWGVQYFPQNLWRLWFVFAQLRYLRRRVPGSAPHGSLFYEHAGMGVAMEDDCGGGGGVSNVGLRGSGGQAVCGGGVSTDVPTMRSAHDGSSLETME